MRLTMLPAAPHDREWAAARDWAKKQRYQVRIPSPGEAWRHELAGVGVAWCHAGDAVPDASRRDADDLQRWVEGGGRLLLSILATPLAQRVGAPGTPPEVQRPSPWRAAGDPLWPPDFHDWPDFPHVRGIQGWGEHPLFDGLVRGAFTWRGVEGEVTSRTVYVTPRWPAGGVVGVDRAYVQLDAATAVAWEYELGAGRILCLGANVALASADRSSSAQRDRLLVNALAYLDPRRDQMGGRRSWWPRVTSRSPPAAEVALVPPALAASVAAESRDAPLLIRSDSPDESAFALAGRRSLLLGTERDGVRELWCHPLCIWSDGDQWRVDGAPLRAVSVTVTPGTVVRELEDIHGGTWRETVAVSPSRPAAHVALTPLVPPATRARAPSVGAELTVSLRLRLQWPMPNDALHPLRAVLAREDTRYSVLVATADERMLAAIVVDGAERCTVDEGDAHPRLHIRAAAGGELRLAAVASCEGLACLTSEVREAAEEGIGGCVTAQARRVERLLESAVAVATPEPTLDAAWPWAVARLAAAVADVPGLGTGLLAGLAASRPGWGDSRPGYAWFFGRDACWSGDALLAAGLFDEARGALELLAATADAEGKIAHEVTMSGVAHYDAADATPLWIRFVAAYAEWTGDLGTVRAHWDTVRAALAFVHSTDRDGDALPENTGVGHGWIESGPLGGGAVTAYTTSIWIDALRRIAPIAAALGDEVTDEWASAASRRAAASFEARLRDGDSGVVALHRSASDLLERTVTALGAVPIMLGIDDAPGADHVLDVLAGDDHSTPWGVRLISRRSPRYDPRGYHAGAVWPLFTGWVALAELSRWRTGAALDHLLSNARLAFRHAKGAFDEVLDGDSGERAGVCPDQTWSAAMIVSPVVQGMLGVCAVAYEGRCTLTPRWPAAWRRAEVRRLRVGRSVFSLEMTRMDDGGSEPGEYSYALHLERGAPIDVTVVGRGGDRATARLDVDGGRATLVTGRRPGAAERDGRR